jgi:hypothetical protein
MTKNNIIYKIYDELNAYETETETGKPTGDDAAVA